MYNLKRSSVTQFENDRSYAIRNGVPSRALIEIHAVLSAVFNLNVAVAVAACFVGCETFVFKRGSSRGLAFACHFNNEYVICDCWQRAERGELPGLLLSDAITAS